MLYNKRSIEKVLSAIYLDNDLLVSPEYPLKLNDFALKKYQAIYSAMYNLYTMGSSGIDVSDIVGYFQQQNSLYSKFVEDGGVDSLYEICNDTGPTNFLYNYKTIKKYSLLNDLVRNGIDITDILDESAPNPELEQQLAKFNALDVEDIFKHYSLKINKLQNSYSNFLEKSCISGSEGIEELFRSLQTLPEVGLPLDGDIFNTIARGARLKKLYIDSGSTGTGKALLNGSKVMTPQGPRIIEKMKVGDDIYGEDGKVYQVLGVYPQGEKDIYKITFNDRREVYCCEEHLWNYQTASMRGDKSSKWKTGTTLQILNQEGLKKKGTKFSKGMESDVDYRWNIYIPMTEPVPYSKQELPIKPYAFGAMLGDGYIRTTGGNPNFTNTNEEIIDRVSNELSALGVELKSYGRPCQYDLVNSKKIKEIFNSLGLGASHSGDKFIPDIYKYSTVEDRINLLSGIFDTDGSVDNSSSIDITLKSEKLIDDIREICESLGLSATKSVREATGYKLENEFINCGTAYRLRIKLNEKIGPLFYCSDKKGKISDLQKPSCRNIHSIEKMSEKGEMTCIATSNPTRLFLTDGYVVTHNSRRMVGNACHLAIPMYYDTIKEEWINTGLNQKVLYITTELDHAEIQTLLMAYVSGVNEEHILNNRYIGDEKERVELAVQYIIQNDNFIIEVFPNPDLITISTNIKKHVLQDDVKYVFYDYIHITPGLVQDRDKQMRDDVILMLLSSTLKELANELDIHISSSTQLNGEYEEKEIKNQNLIRGSKAVADKADIGIITLPPSKAEEELGMTLSLKLQTPVPNMITDVYKNRRGKWTGVRIWRYVDLGTCRVADCFITDRRNEPIDFDSMRIQVKQANHNNGFVVANNTKERNED